jgi:hypothetical protein
MRILLTIYIRYLQDLEKRLGSVEQMLSTIITESPSRINAAEDATVAGHRVNLSEENSSIEVHGDAEHGIVFAAEGTDGFFGKQINLFYKVKLR